MDLPEPDNDATRVLCDEGLSADARAAKLLPIIYQQLRAVAQQQMSSERRNHTLQATALVHEAYLRLIGDRKIPWQNMAHFYTAAAEAMRHILLDHARAKGRLKRGGDRKQVAVNILDLAASDNAEQIVALDDAFKQLEAENPEAAQLVRLRFYCGLSMADTAEAMQIPRRTLDRRWEYARAWLARAIGESQDQERRTGDADDAS